MGKIKRNTKDLEKYCKNQNFQEKEKNQTKVLKKVLKKSENYFRKFEKIRILEA